MIERISVVLPAPLRPTRLTMAPLRDVHREAAQCRHRLDLDDEIVDREQRRRVAHRTPPVT